MKYQFFTIPVHGNEDLQAALNQFCTNHTIATLEKEFVANGDNSFWSICLSYLDKTEKVIEVKKGKVDYKDILSEEDFIVYAKLRELRKNKAEQEGIPAYAVFTNEQLATMVRQRTTSVSAMSEVDGVGKSKQEKYGQAFISLLQQCFKDKYVAGGVNQNETIPS